MFTIQHLEGELLSANFQVAFDKSITKLLQDAEVFSLGWFRGGATIKQMPLLNIHVIFGMPLQQLCTLWTAYHM